MLRKLLFAAAAASLSWLPACSVDTPDQPTAPDSDPGVIPGPANPGNPSSPAPVSGPVVREIRGGRLHKKDMVGFTGIDASSIRAVFGAAKAELPAQLGAFEADDFTVLSRETSRTLSGAALTHVTLQQTINGVPVDGTYLRLTSSAADRSGTAKLMSSSFRLYGESKVDTTPALDRDTALSVARKSLRVSERTPLVKGELRIRKVEKNLQLVWEVAAKGSHYRALVIANGSQRGRVLLEDARHYADGTVTGAVVLGGAPGGNGTISVQPVSDSKVNGVNGATANTDQTGRFTLNVANGTNVQAVLSGRASIVTNDSGQNLVASGAAGANMSLVLGNANSPATDLAQTTAFVLVDKTREYLEANGVPSDVLGDPLQTNVNLPDICNAFYSPFERTINFFSAGGGCRNTAIDTVISHEYGHFIDDMAGGIIDGGLSEGWGDLLGCFIFNTPIVGEDFLDDGGFIRSCENDYVFPPGGFDEVHALGQAWAGFAWRARQGFIAEFGAEQGDALARALILPSLMTNSPDIPESVREVFLRDDDDGNLDNETPHWHILFPAAEHHGLAFAIDPDLTPPAAVTDLSAGSVQATSVTLQWTAPGDDGNEGTAAQYDLRFSTTPIDESNFFAATPVPAPAPSPAGSFESVSVTVPPAATVYFALASVDEQFNTSTLSNVIEVTTPEGVTIYHDGAENGLSWEASGLWHITQRRASEGGNSFWYGQESTGNYDTPGQPNSGTLVSPVISLAGAVSPVLSYFEFVETEDGSFFDAFDVTVTNIDDPSQTLVFPKSTGNTLGSFVPRVIPLAGFENANIQITLSFNTGDEIFNDFEGWYVDDVRIVGSDTGSTCEHPVCEQGGPLTPDCDECAATVCAVDAFCCEVAWDGICVFEAEDLCGLTCTNTCGDGICSADESCETCEVDCGPCAPTCDHDLCLPGTPLDPTCDSCAAVVCEADSFCCETLWDRICVQEAEQLCGLQCQGCAHDQCSVGEPLEATCDDCTANVCAADPYCCEVAWDGRCVNEAAQICGLTCEGCTHSLCEAGGPLSQSCDPCVEAVCAQDSFCCTNAWDDRCVASAAATCGIDCGSFR